MKKCFGIAVCILLILGFTRPPERIAWDADAPVGWEDFRGLAKSIDGYAASSSTGLSQSYEISTTGYLNKSSAKITAHFYPEFSWYHAKDTTDYLLAHERAHFDITEIHARKLRKRVIDFNFTQNAKAEIQVLYEQIEKERQAMQEQFDKETNHSRNKIQEKAWEEVIEKLLEKYWVYTS